MTDPIPHGTQSGYGRFKCRCDDCKLAHRERVRLQRAARKARPIPPGVPHGDASTYGNYLCRCEPCKAAHAVVLRKQRESRRARLHEAPHGTISGYSSWGCRCPLCMEAGRRKAAQTKARRKRLKG